MYKMLRKIEKETTIASVVNNDGSIHVPKGYMYCSDCGALTPHSKHKNIYSCLICSNKKYSYDLCPHCGWEHNSDNYQPDVIYHTIHNDGCHFNEIVIKSNYNDVTPETYNIANLVIKEFKKDVEKMLHEKYPNIILANGCEIHKSNTKMESSNIRIWRKRLREMEDMECGCPRIPIFPIGIKIRNYECHSITSFDCMNAMEWSYEVMCPICGTWFDCGDSNC